MYTEKKKASNKKYSDLHIKNITLTVKNEENDLIVQNAQKFDMKRATFIRKCIKYCIENKVDLSNVD